MKRTSRGVFDNETLRDIGERIRTARGVDTQEDFAKRIGVGRTVLANYEAGRRLPSRETLMSISKHSGSSVNYLLTGLESHRDPFDIAASYSPAVQMQEGFALALFVYEKLREKFSNKSEAEKLIMWGSFVPNLAEHFQEIIGDNVASKNVEYLDAVEEVMEELAEAKSEDLMELVLDVNSRVKR